MKSFQCTCGNALFFESSRCLACGLDVGYEPMLGLIRRIDKNYRLCGNGQRYAACNWLVPASTGEAFCVSCRLNRTIPDVTLKTRVRDERLGGPNPFRGRSPGPGELVPGERVAPSLVRADRVSF